jgi:hypothetical protein
VGYAVFRAVRSFVLTLQIRVQSQLTTCEIHGGRSGTGADFRLSSIEFLLLTLPSELCDSPEQAAPYHICGL